VKLYNSVTRTKEEFEPLNPPFVGIYVCGPTVYGHSHLGHGKSYVGFDVLVRWLRSRGYSVRYVQNITDVGHLTDDADQGEDKLQKQAVLEKLEPMELAEKYTASYFHDMDALNNLRPDVSPRASGHIPEQIELVGKLIAGGHAYVSGGNVYFDVSSFPRYGSLSGRSGEDAMSGTRVETASDKRDPRDFALWKKAEASHLLKWNSPWGRGYPGWHLECSAMSMRYLGDTIDIHGGGLENSFPHHECEIAQSEAATGKPFARFWLHNNMVTVDGRKMGKSLGNHTLLRDIFKKFDPMVVRLYILRSHYRSPLDFSDQGLQSAQSALERLVSFRNRLEKASSAAPGGAEALCAATKKAFTEAMDDDLNTPQALAVLFDFVRAGNTMLDAGEGGTEFMTETLDNLAGEVLGLRLDSAGRSAGAEEVCAVLARLRGVLRTRKLFEEADEMRRSLESLGFVVKDLPGGESEISPGGASAH